MTGLSTMQTIGLLVGLAIVTAGLLLAARHPPPTMVTMGMALITLAILAAWVADPARADNLIPLLGVGLGALASALTSLFDPDRKKDDGGDGEP